MIYDFASGLETQLTSGAGISGFSYLFDGYKPPFDAEGDQVVYVTSAGELYYLRLSNPTPRLISASAGSGAHARHSIGRIVWVETAGGVGSLYAYEIAG